MISETNEQTQGPPLAPGGSSVMRPVAATVTAGAVPNPVWVTPDTDYVIHLSPEAADELNQLMALTGDTPTRLLQKALSLYKVTQQAIHEGKAVGIAESADSLESQFVGI